MSSIIVTIMMTLALGAVGLPVLYFLFHNFQPGKNRIIADLEKMKLEMKEWTDNLVPWTKEEMDLLSFEQVNNTIKRGLAKSAKGVFTSIYHEPLIAYNYKRYLSTGDNAILYARTSKHEFAYRVKKKEIAININNEYAGVLRENGGFYGGPKGRLIARINRGDHLELHPIIIGDKEIASVVNPMKSLKHNPRAFQFVKPMEEQEENIVLALTILEMVTESLGDKQADKNKKDIV